MGSTAQLTPNSGGFGSGLLRALRNLWNGGQPQEWDEHLPFQGTRSLADEMGWTPAPDTPAPYVPPPMAGAPKQPYVVDGYGNPTDPIATDPQSGTSVREEKPTLLQPGEKQAFDPSAARPTGGPFGGGFASFDMGPSSREQDLESRLDTMTHPQGGLKGALLRMAGPAIMTGLGAALGGGEGATGAAEGSLSGMQREQEIGLQQRSTLQRELEAELNREGEQRRAGMQIEAEEPIRQAQIEGDRARANYYDTLHQQQEDAIDQRADAARTREDTQLRGRGLMLDDNGDIVDDPHATQASSLKQALDEAEHGLKSNGQGGFEIDENTPEGRKALHPPRDPNAPKPATPAQRAAARAQYDKNLSTAERNFQKRVGSSDEWKALLQSDPDEAQDALDELTTAKQQAQDEYEGHMRDIGAAVSHYTYPRMMAPRAQYRVGDTVTYNGKRMRVSGVRGDGKLELSPAGSQ